jgi:hypothetical protein
MPLQVLGQGQNANVILQHLLYKTSKAEFLPSLLISLYSNEVEKWFPFGFHLSHLPF